MSHFTRARAALAVPMAALLAAPPAHADECFKPQALLEQRQQAFDDAVNPYALLHHKAEKGLFDLRLCKPGWCPASLNMNAEGERIASRALLEGATDAMVTVGTALDVGVAESFFETLAKSVTGKEAKDVIKERKEKLEKALDKRIGAFEAAAGAAEDDARQARSQLVHAMHNHNYTMASVTQLEKIKEKRKTARVQWRVQKLKQAQARTAGVLNAVQSDYHRALTSMAEAKRSVEDYKRAKELLGKVGDLQGAIETVEAFRDRKVIDSVKGTADILKPLVEWQIERLAGDAKDAEKALRDARHKYTVQSRKRGGVLAPGMEAQLTKAITDAQVKGVEVSQATELLQGFKAGIEWAGKVAKLAEDADKAYAQAQEIVAKVDATRGAAAGRVPERIGAALGYFQAVSSSARTLAGYSPPLLKALLNGAADQFQLVVEVPLAFARLRDRASQGAQITASGGLVLQDDLFAGHPIVGGLVVKLSGDPNVDSSLRYIPNAARSQKVELTQDEYLTMWRALSTWTGLTLRNPTQEDLYDIAGLVKAGGSLQLPIPEYGSAGLSNLAESVSVDGLAGDGRFYFEKKMGSAIRELSFINRAIKDSGQAFKPEDMLFGGPSSFASSSDRAARAAKSKVFVQLQGISTRHRVLDEACRIAYGLPLSDKMFAAMINVANPTDRTNVSELEKKLLQRRNARVNAAGVAPPVRIAWIRGEQLSDRKVQATVSLETGKLAPDAQVCRKLVAKYPDGTEARMVPAAGAAAGSPLTATYVLDGLDWEKAGSPGSVTLEATAVAGGAVDRRSEYVRLDAPVSVDDIVVMPGGSYQFSESYQPAASPAKIDDTDIGLSGLYAGDEVKLLVSGTVSPLLEGSVVPTVTFRLKAGKGAPVAIRAARTAELNGVAFLAEGSWRSPETATSVDVEATVEAGRFKTTRTTSFTLQKLSEDVPEFAPSVAVHVRAAVPGKEPKDFPSVTGAKVTFSNGETKETGPFGTTSFGPLDAGGYSADAEPPAWDKNHGPGQGKTTLADYEPGGPDPNKYTIEITLPYQKTPEPTPGPQVSDGHKGPTGGGGTPVPPGGGGGNGTGGPGGSGGSGGKKPGGPGGSGGQGGTGSGGGTATPSPVIGQTIGEITANMGNCEYEDALRAAEAMQQQYGSEPAWQTWAAGNLDDLRRTALAQKAAREHLRRGKAAIEAKKLDESIAHLQQALGVAGVPECLRRQMASLLEQLQRHKRFATLTDQVARAGNDECDFKKAAQLIAQIQGIAPRETFMQTWLDENAPKIADLQKRESQAMTILGQARAAAAAAQQPAELEAALKLAEQARDAAPGCVRQREQIDGLIADINRKKNPQIETSIVLLIDTSGSMSSNDKIGQAKRAAEAAVRKASRSTEMAVLQFDGGCSAGSTRVVHDFSTDANSLMRSIGGLQPGGGTPMYIATGVAVEYAKKTGRGKSRLVVLMSDGGDSCRDKMNEAAAGIRTSNIPINTIGFDVGNDAQAKGDLANLSGMTGGRSIGASAADPREIIRAFDMAMLPSLLKDVDVSGGGGGALSTYFSQAKSLVAQQDLGGALFQVQQARKLAPESPAVHFNLSLLHEANDQLIPAMTHAREYLKLAPSAFDRADVESRITNLQDELKRNPREMSDPTACRDVYDWAQIEQDRARKSRGAERRQKMLEILIASQKGDCVKARGLAEEYKKQNP